MRTRGLLALATIAMIASLYGATGAVSRSSGVANVPQGTQSDKAYAQSVQKASVTNVFATTQATSCYRPEVPAPFNDGPALGYSGETACNGTSTTGEDTGAAAPYATQAGSNPGYATGPP
jgi:hypothetical protein